MNKDLALNLLGGAAAAAQAIGISIQAVNKWPEPLPPRIADRVVAALVRLGKPVPQEFLRRIDVACAGASEESAA